MGPSNRIVSNMPYFKAQQPSQQQCDSDLKRMAPTEKRPQEIPSKRPRPSRCLKHIRDRASSIGNSHTTKQPCERSDTNEGRQIWRQCCRNLQQSEQEKTCQKHRSSSKSLAQRSQNQWPNTQRTEKCRLPEQYHLVVHVEFFGHAVNARREDGASHCAGVSH